MSAKKKKMYWQDLTGKISSIEITGVRIFIFGVQTEYFMLFDLICSSVASDIQSRVREMSGYALAAKQAVAPKMSEDELYVDSTVYMYM